MPADAANRKTVREAFAALCVTALANVVDTVYEYEKSVITDKTALMILSGGTLRANSGINDTRWRNAFHLEVLSFVRKANTYAVDGTDAWTEKNVEDKLDEIDKELADVVADNRVNANWSYIEFEEDYSVIADGRANTVQRDQGAVGFKIESRVIRVTYIEAG